MTKRAKLFAGLSAGVLGLATYGGALAQSSAVTSPPPPPGGAGAQSPASQNDVSGGGSALQEVVVTAQRRSQNLQNVPISVTSFSGEALAAQQISSTLDLGREVPNLFASNGVGQASANVYYIRGLGQTQSYPTFEPQVGTYVDDIYLARQNANNLALFGVDQIQVLNGPQGTLFGRNSTGGAILVTLQKPAAEFGGDVQLGYGSFNSFTGRASVDMPLSDQVRTRISAFGITDDGYVQDVTTHQTLNATHDYGVREAVTLLPKQLSNVEWNMAVDYEHNDAGNFLNQPSANGGTNGSNRISYSGFSTDGGALSPYLTGDKGGYGQATIVESYGFTSDIKIKLDAGALNIISGFRGLNQDLGADFPATSLGPLSTADAIPTGEIALAQSLRSDQLSQEVKWNGDILGGRLDYTAGAFYLYEANRNTYGQVLGLAPGVAFPLNDQFFKNQTISEAGYIQGDLKITPKLILTLGGRYTHEVKSVRTTPNVPGEGYSTADVQAEGYKTHLDANEFTPRVALSYQVDPRLLVLASATRGFQGGGWNGLTGANAADFNNFGPETVWSYETGFRSETSDRKLRVNATFFYENVNNYQLLSDNPVTASFDTSNAANLESYGLESTITWKPVDHLTLSSNISAIRALYFGQNGLVRAQQQSCVGGTLTSCDSGIVRADGALATPVYTPPFSAATSATYAFELQALTITPTLTVEYVSREWFDTANTEGSASSFPTPSGGRDKARTLIDFGVTFKPRSLPISITAECKNCTSVDYGIADLLGYDYFNTPGTWDVSVNYRF